METEKVTMRCQDGRVQRLVQLCRCPVCHYFVAEATEIIWRRRPKDMADDGEIESCIFCQQQNKSPALQWTGGNVLEMCAFMKQDISAVSPNGPMEAETSYGKIFAKPGQWVIGKDGKFQVADKP